MKISKIFQSLENRVEIRKYNKEKNLLNLFAKIDTHHMHPEITKELFPARKGIANYALDNGVTVEISSAKNLLRHDTNKNLMITVTNILNGHQRKTLISSDINETFKYYQKGKQLQFDDNFLRNVYRTIETLTKKIKK